MIWLKLNVNATLVSPPLLFNILLYIIIVFFCMLWPNLELEVYAIFFWNVIMMNVFCLH